MDTAIEFTLKNGPGHILYVPYWISFPINSWWTPGKLLMESWWSPHTHHEVNLDFIRSPSGVYQESIRSIRTLLGLLMESIRSPSGVYQEYQDFTRTPDGLHQDLWLSVTYRKKAFDLNAYHLNSWAEELNQLADGVNRMKAFMMPDAEEQQAMWEELHEKESDNGQHLLWPSSDHPFSGLMLMEFFHEYQTNVYNIMRSPMYAIESMPVP